MGLLRRNPFDGIRADRVSEPSVRYVTGDEFAALIAACDGANTPAWWKAFLLLCYCGGLRYGEALNVTWADVDYEHEAISIEPKRETPATLSWQPKDYECRRVPVPAEVINAIASLQELAPAGHAYPFMTPRRVRFIKAAKAQGIWGDTQALMNNTRRAFAGLVKRAGKPAGKWSGKPAVKWCGSLVDPDGNPTMSLHDLRRTAITNWTKNTNIQTVQALAGHSSVISTMKYYAAVTEDQFKLARAAAAVALPKYD